MAVRKLHGGRGKPVRKEEVRVEESGPSLPQDAEAVAARERVEAYQMEHPGLEPYTDEEIRAMSGKVPPQCGVQEA